jgi:hypothetical protein
MILFQQYCALDATINDEIHRGCHLIVNFLQSRGDKYLGQRVMLNMDTRCLYLDFLRRLLLISACKTPLVDRYSGITRKLSRGGTVLVPLTLHIPFASAWLLAAAGQSVETGVIEKRRTEKEATTLRRPPLRNILIRRLSSFQKMSFKPKSSCRRPMPSVLTLPANVAPPLELKAVLWNFPMATSSRTGSGTPRNCVFMMLNACAWN